MKVQPVSRMGWCAYYWHLYCKTGRAAALHLALWYELLAHRDEEVAS